MLIAFDIDDTILNGMDYHIIHGEKYFNKKANVNHYALEDIFEVSAKEALDYIRYVCNDYRVNGKPFDNVVNFINELSKNNTIMFLTNRGYFQDTKLPDYLERLQTIDWLNKNGFRYDGIFFNMPKTPKTALINELNIDIMFEDAKYQVEAILKSCDKVKRVYLKSYLHNKGINDERVQYFDNYKNLDIGGIINENFSHRTQT